MSESQLGSAYVTIQAKIDDLEAQLAEARAEFERTADEAERQSRRAGSAVAKVGEAASATATETNKAGGRIRRAWDGITGGLTRAGDAGTKTQAVLGKVLVPVAAVASVKVLVDAVRNAGREVDQLKRNWDATVQRIEQSNLDLAIENPEAGVQALREIRAEIDQVQSELDSFLDGKNVVDQVKLALSGTTFDEVVKEAETRIDRLQDLAAERVRIARKRAVEEQLAEQEAITEQFAQSRLSALDRIYTEERSQLDELAQVREKAQTDEQRRRAEEAIAAVRTEYDTRRAEAMKLIADEQAAREQAEQDRVDSINAQAESIELAGLDPLERRIAELGSQLGEVRDELETARQNDDPADGTNPVAWRLFAVVAKHAAWFGHRRTPADRALVRSAGVFSDCERVWVLKSFSRAVTRVIHRVGIQDC